MFLEQYDLGVVLNSLANNKSERVFCGTLRQFTAVSSALIDMRHAMESLQLLMQMDAEHGYNDAVQDEIDTVLVRALAVHAIVLYARSTSTSSKHRSKFDINNYLSPTQRIGHKRIMDLRNDSVAHFGTGGDTYADYWARETVVVAKAMDMISVGFDSTRANYKGADLTILADLLATLIPKFEELKVEKQATAQALVVQRWNADENFRNVLAKAIYVAPAHRQRRPSSDQTKGATRVNRFQP